MAAILLFGRNRRNETTNQPHLTKNRECPVKSPETKSGFNQKRRRTAIPFAKFPVGKPLATHIPPAYQPPLPAGEPRTAHTSPANQPPLPAGEPRTAHTSPANQPPLPAGEPPAAYISPSPNPHYLLASLRLSFPLLNRGLTTSRD